MTRSCPTNVCWLERKKNVDQSQQTSRSGKCTLDLEKFRSWLSSRKDQKGLMKGANYSVYSQTFAQEATFTISLKKIPRRLNLLKGSRLSYKTIKCEKKFCLLFSFKVTPPLHHPKNNFMSKWHLIQPLHREITKNQRLSPWFSSEQKSLVTYHTLSSLHVCVWLVNSLTSTAPIGSPVMCMWSPADICEQWERNLSFG